jgi:hypothetical protein
MRGIVAVALLLGALLLAAGVACAQRAAGAVELTTVPERQEVEMVVYAAQDLTHITDRRLIELAEGVNRVQFDWADTQIDPTSVRLRAADDKGELSVKNILFPADRPNALVWLVESATAGKRLLEVSYFTKGLSWQPTYQAILTPEGDKMSLKGFLRIANNSGEDYPNAQVSLVVGDLHLVSDEILRNQLALGEPLEADRGEAKAETRPRRATGAVAAAEAPPLAPAGGFGGGMPGMAPPAEAVAVAAGAGVSEHFVYQLGTRETIENGWGKQLLSFSAWPVPFEVVHKYAGGKNPTVFLKFKNDKDHQLGSAPLAEGPISIFQRTADGALNAIADTKVPHTAVGDEAEVPLQTDLDVVIEPKLMDYKKLRFDFDQYKRIAGWEEERSFRIEITNSKTTDITLEVKQAFDGVWSITSPQEYEKKSATEVEWRLKVPAGQKAVIEYVLTQKFGTRIQVAEQGGEGQ